MHLTGTGHNVSPWNIRSKCISLEHKVIMHLIKAYGSTFFSKECQNPSHWSIKVVVSVCVCVVLCVYAYVYIFLFLDLTKSTW